VHETYENSPYDEQLQYLMDTRSQILFTYMVSADTRLARKAMHDFRCSLLPNGLLQSRYPSRQPQIIPVLQIFISFSWWRIITGRPGETEHIREYRSVIDGILNGLINIGESGLIEIWNTGHL
jgi:alpha-L-rhamnosidase